MNAWGIFILLAGVLFVFLGITGKAESVLNHARIQTGNPVKAP